MLEVVVYFGVGAEVEKGVGDGVEGWGEGVGRGGGHWGGIWGVVVYNGLLGKFGVECDLRAMVWIWIGVPEGGDLVADNCSRNDRAWREGNG